MKPPPSEHQHVCISSVEDVPINHAAMRMYESIREHPYAVHSEPWDTVTKGPLAMSATSTNAPTTPTLEFVATKNAHYPMSIELDRFARSPLTEQVPLTL